MGGFANVLKFNPPVVAKSEIKQAVGQTREDSLLSVPHSSSISVASYLFFGVHD
jgi:hypothetical protein